MAGSSTARALHELAESRSAVAAVVGSSDRGALGRLFPGSTAERLLHGAPTSARGLGHISSAMRTRTGDSDARKLTADGDRGDRMATGALAERFDAILRLDRAQTVEPLERSA